MTSMADILPGGCAAAQCLVELENLVMLQELIRESKYRQFGRREISCFRSTIHRYWPRAIFPVDFFFFSTTIFTLGLAILVFHILPTQAKLVRRLLPRAPSTS